MNHFPLLFEEQKEELSEVMIVDDNFFNIEVL